MQRVFKIDLKSKHSLRVMCSGKVFKSVRCRTKTSMAAFDGAHNIMRNIICLFTASCHKLMKHYYNKLKITTLLCKIKFITHESC